MEPRKRFIREENQESSQQQHYVARQLAYPIEPLIQPLEPEPQTQPQQQTQSPSQSRVSLAISSDSFLKLGTDRTSISKLLAKRRASAPVVSHGKRNTMAHHASTHAPHTHTRAPQAREQRAKGARTEVYGFVCWITTFVAYGFFLLWGYSPERVLRSLGVYYFPNKYWVVAMPSYLLVLISFGILAYVCLNFMYCDPLNSFNTFTRDVPISHDHGHQEHENSIPPASDVPLTLVNELLYQKKKPVNESSPTFSITNSRASQRPRVYFSNKNRLDELIPLRGDCDISLSSSLSSSTTDSAENSEGEGTPSKTYDHSKRTNLLYSPFSPSSPSSPSSPDSSPIRRTSSYSLLKEDM